MTILEPTKKPDWLPQFLICFIQGVVTKKLETSLGKFFGFLWYQKFPLVEPPDVLHGLISYSGSLKKLSRMTENEPGQLGALNEPQLAYPIQGI